MRNIFEFKTREQKARVVVAIIIIVVVAGLLFYGEDVLASDGWVSPLGYTDSSSHYTSESLAYDESTSTACSGYVPGGGTWSGFLELSRPDAVTCTKIRVWLGRSSVNIVAVDIDLYYNSGWNNLYQGNPTWGSYYEISIGSTQNVTAMRLRFAKEYSASATSYIYEADFYGSVCAPASVVMSPAWQSVAIGENMTFQVEVLDCESEGFGSAALSWSWVGDGSIQASDSVSDSSGLGDCIVGHNDSGSGTLTCALTVYGLSDTGSGLWGSVEGGGSVGEGGLGWWQFVLLGSVFGLYAYSRSLLMGLGFMMGCVGMVWWVQSGEVEVSAFSSAVISALMLVWLAVAVVMMVSSRKEVAF